MPDDPQAPPADRDGSPHDQREVAESFGQDADRYDRSRPSYPDALVERVAGAIPGPRVVDVGIGTGIAARQLRAAGYQVLGIEVDDRMAQVARRDGFDVEVARFEEWEPAGRTFDAVVAGQAWHWVDPVAGTAKAAAVLPAGGRLAVFWNVFEPPPEVAAAFSAVYERVLGDSRMGRVATSGMAAYGAILSSAAGAMGAAPEFGAPEEWRFGWERTFTRGEWLDQVPTFGGFSRLPAAAQAEMLSATGEAVDAVGGRFTMPYTSVVVTAGRVDV